MCLHIKISGGSLSTEVGREYLGQKDSERMFIMAKCASRSSNWEKILVYVR